MSLFVDTSVWSLALRRDAGEGAAVAFLRHSLETGTAIYTTGLVLQELLQGFDGPRAKEAIVARFQALELLAPELADHVRAAEARNACRRHGVQIGTIDALLAALCIRHRLTMLTVDRDFQHLARTEPLRLWKG